MNGEKTKVALLFGGTSPEHEVSRNSAASVARYIDTERYELFKIGITKDSGRWILTEATPEEMSDGSWESLPGNKHAVLSPDREEHGLVIDGKAVRIDVVFPMFHGECGEDGTIQGLLEIADIPYVGSGVAASACCMDKTITKILAAKTGVRQAGYYETDIETFRNDPKKVISEIEKTHGGKYPLFVKSASTGSSVGISKVNDRAELERGIEKALAVDTKVIIEETIVGREFEVAVLGNEDPKASPVGEVISYNEFYDYEAKYSTELSSTRVVDDISKEKEKEYQQAAVDIYKALGCRGMARVDFFYMEDGTLVFNELNTIPGFTPTSMYPQLWQAAGLRYDELITKLIELAVEGR